MCLAIPAQVSVLQDDGHVAMVDIMGVRRKVSIDLLVDDPPLPGEWVLVHVGFAMSKISARQAEEQLQMLALLGEASDGARRSRRLRVRRRVGRGKRPDAQEREVTAMKYVDEFRDPRHDPQGASTKSARWPIRSAITASWKSAAATRTPFFASG